QGYLAVFFTKRLYNECIDPSYVELSRCKVVDMVIRIWIFQVNAHNLAVSKFSLGRDEEIQCAGIEVAGMPYCEEAACVHPSLKDRVIENNGEEVKIYFVLKI